MNNLSIGAVARMTHIPAHTLRKWESRHKIGVPSRSGTGRRVYSAEDVELLKLVKTLVDSGHSLAHLAGLDIAQLSELAQMHQPASSPQSVTSLHLAGPSIAHFLPGNNAVKSRFSGNFDAWLEENSDGPIEGAVVAESNTLPPPIVSALCDLSKRAEAVLIIYTFASRGTLNKLAKAGVITIQAPANEATILRSIEPAPSAPSPERKPRRFTNQELVRVAALNPGLKCECPNHIAKLLMDISAFETYSLECIDSDPKEQILHAKLCDISAQARALFEDALTTVAAADGLQLNVSPQAE